MSAELAADDFQSQFQELIDGALGLFVVDPSDAHDDAGPNDVEKVLIAEQRVKEWRAQTKHRVDQARDDLRAITREYKQAEVASQRSTALPSTEAHEAKMTTMRQARLAGMKANSELEQQVYHLQGELERLQQELKDEEAEAVDALELSSEVLRIKLYRDMGFLPIEENGIFTKVVVPPPPVPADRQATPQYPIPPWAQRLPKFLRWTHPYLSLARMDKPIGTWLLYWPCAWGITMAAYSSSLPVSSWAWNLALFGTGAVVMRGAGCTINDLWDRDIDKKVDRTKLRPLASGEIKPLQALTFLGGQLSLGLAVLTQLNWYSIALGASSLSLVVAYPLMKRITYWPQFVLGSVAWTIVYDTIYAHQDKTDDVSAGVKSTALLFGEQTRPILTAFSASFVSLLALSGYLNAQGPAFYALSVGGAAAHLAWQLRKADLDSRESCWAMFKSNRDLGAIVWSGMAVDYALKVAAVSAL
ncbi:hypothetical protein Rhopal_001692-T1 [Rhodotorula paludigena]|uniref:4-hydroxybenzoate polyprenyltransferase, mitochondrial n=1 Tax=Rhodotorula paludigena TaxID=86838 RepID=A0AAV5G839_9BASI|nr:hypothetical protein Rhopal_001692-T1 [Rhodotorula paludigena]